MPPFSEEDVELVTNLVCGQNFKATFTYSGDQINKTEIGRACSTYGREKRCMQDFGGET